VSIAAEAQCSNSELELTVRTVLWNKYVTIKDLQVHMYCCKLEVVSTSLSTFVRSLSPTAHSRAHASMK
jgi:hypothetical protein